MRNNNFNLKKLIEELKETYQPRMRNMKNHIWEDTVVLFV